MQHLAGIRDLILAQYNDLTEAANQRLVALHEAPAANPQPRREEPSTPVNPITQDARAGGRVTGIANDALTGAPIEGAFVGFKRLRESTDYFYQTQTGVDGSYTTPYLLPGQYFVDIRKPGRIDVRGQGVTVRQGVEAHENVALSQPLGEGVYRVTLSWCGEKADAVKDVDSYLLIPGNPNPLSYTNKQHEYDGAYLDRDDTDWIGPETITIHTLKQGTYRYYVNNYNVRNNLRALGNSEVRVKLYKGNTLLRDFSVPPGIGLSYELFRIENGQVREIGAYDANLPMH
jgi:hypothetical protein